MTKASAVPARSKYGAVRTVVDGITFASKKEARRYQELVLLQRAGEIRNLKLQPQFPLGVLGQPVCVYVADFSYQELLRRNGNVEWLTVVEDVKGGSIRTPVYRLKAKLLKAITGIAIRET